MSLLARLEDARTGRKTEQALRELREDVTELVGVVEAIDVRLKKIEHPPVEVPGYVIAALGRVLEGLKAI